MMRRILVISVGVAASVVALMLCLYRRDAGKLKVLFAGYQLESINVLDGNKVLSDPVSLTGAVEGPLQAGHVYVFRKTAQIDNAQFARFQLPLRIWLAHCRVTQPTGRLLQVYEGPPPFQLGYSCAGFRGVISNRRVESRDHYSVREQLIVTANGLPDRSSSVGR